MTPADYLDFRRGDCALLSVVLYHEHGFPIYGLYEAGEDRPHHLFVLDGDEVIDADGRRPMEGAFTRYQGSVVRELSLEDAKSLDAGYDDEEYDYACSVSAELT